MWCQENHNNIYYYNIYFYIIIIITITIENCETPYSPFTLIWSILQSFWKQEKKKDVYFLLIVFKTSRFME